MKICVVTPRYAIAGVPLAQLRLARVLANKGHDVDLLIGCIEPEYPFPEAVGINLQNMNCLSVREMFFPLRRYLQRAKPDVVFSAEDHLNAIVLLAAITCASRAKISCSSS